MAAEARRVLVGYRALLRSIRTTFRSDRAAVRHCEGLASAAFRKHSGETSAETVAQLLREAADAADFLRGHIAQARLNSSGQYGGSSVVVADTYLPRSVFQGADPADPASRARTPRPISLADFAAARHRGIKAWRGERAIPGGAREMPLSGGWGNGDGLRNRSA